MVVAGAGSENANSAKNAAEDTAVAADGLLRSSAAGAGRGVVGAGLETSRGGSKSRGGESEDSEGLHV